jgi:hypothetical protein
MEEMARITEQKAKEQKKLADLNSKIISANHMLMSIKNSSIAKSKLNKISRYQTDMAKCEKNLADFEYKLVQKNKELNIEQKRLTSEEMREATRIKSQQNEFQKNQTSTLNNFARVINRHDHAIKEMQILPKEIVILFFASNPVDHAQLGLDEEVRAIREMILKSKHRDSVKLESCWAVRPGDILQAMNEYKPTIVHFSGHGSDNDELILMDFNRNTKYVSIDAIVQAMSVANDNLHLVFFNTCYSHNQAENITKYIDIAIGMKDSITDNAARIFASQFYSSISFGLSVGKSFQQARAALLLEGIQEDDIPILFIKDGIDPNNIFMISNEEYFPRGVLK